MASRASSLKSFVPKFKEAWLRRIKHAAVRVYDTIGLHSEAVMQKALASELQTYEKTSVAQEVLLPICYTNSKDEAINVGTVRLDIVYSTPLLKFVLELKVAGHSRRATLAQLAKYRRLLDAEVDDSTLVLVEFNSESVGIFVLDANSNVVRAIA